MNVKLCFTVNPSFITGQVPCHSYASGFQLRYNLLFLGPVDVTEVIQICINLFKWEGRGSEIHKYFNPAAAKKTGGSIDCKLT